MAERTVYILDDDVAVLRSLERLLSSASFEPIAFDNPDAFLAAATTFKTGCVLLDVRLPGMSGLDVQTQLLKMRTDLAVIVVTGQGDIQTAVRAGATDFLEKPYSDHALLGSIEMAFGKGTFSDRDRDIADAARRVATLSPREREVLEGLLTGRPNKLIAYHLGISVRTVEVHRARMMERLGVRQLAGHTPGRHRKAEDFPARQQAKGLDRNPAWPQSLQAAIEPSPERSSRAPRFRILTVRLPARVMTPRCCRSVMERQTVSTETAR